MKIYYNIDDFSPVKNAVVTSGTFDGVHIGHQTIINRLKEIAGRISGETVLITYWPHPRFILNPTDTKLQLLNTFEEKADLLRAQGVEHLLRIPFTREFSQISSNDFVRNILVDTIGTRKLVIGYDHRFGKNREGSFEELKKNGPTHGFEVEEIPRQDVDDVAVSSSKIRTALREGDVRTATHFLGRPYSISGRVVKGDSIGRTLGFPTANIEIDSHHKLVPVEGIYAVTVDHQHRQYGGMLYIGNRPTINGTRKVIEVNIFDFHQDIYGETLKVNLIESLREDVKFEDLNGLKAQLAIDQQNALRVLSSR